MTHTSNEYAGFLERKAHSGNDGGFDPIWMPGFLFDFQASMVEWALRKGRSALFEDCGLGKTPQELVWAENVVRKTNGRVLNLTPCAVAHQTISEAEKFGIEARRSYHGELYNGIVVANYERLHHFNPHDFVGIVGDESSILKSFDGETRAAVTDFARHLPYRLLATATAAPNDYIELGTTSEALGELGYMDMLNRFLKNDQGNSSTGRAYLGGQNKWRFKGHAETPFWRWVTSWARAIRKPSDLGFEDGRFSLPPLIEREHLVDCASIADGMLFSLPAADLREQRAERRRSIKERCERVAELVSDGEQALVWCHLNDEGDLLEDMVDGATQVAGKDSDEAKEDRFLAFARGELRVLVTKPTIGAWGLNFQRCAHVTAFPSHSYEQHYQGIRRCWRFGQTRPVRVDVVTTEGERGVMQNLQRKAAQADRMFSALVEHMNTAMGVNRASGLVHREKAPAWL